MATATELGFRAQLVIPEQRQIYDYWLSCFNGEKLPARKDISPCDFPRLLPLVSLVEVVGEKRRLRVRLAGTELREYYGVDITGIYLDDLDFSSKSEYWQAAFHRVTAERRPAQGIVKGAGKNKEHLTHFWIRLPLSEDGENVSMILSYDVFVPVAKAQLLSETNGMDTSLMAPTLATSTRISGAL